MYIKKILNVFLLIIGIIGMFFSGVIFYVIHYFSDFFQFFSFNYDINNIFLNKYFYLGIFIFSLCLNIFLLLLKKKYIIISFFFFILFFLFIFTFIFLKQQNDFKNIPEIEFSISNIDESKDFSLLKDESKDFSYFYKNYSLVSKELGKNINLIKYTKLTSELRQLNEDFSLYLSNKNLSNGQKNMIIALINKIDLKISFSKALKVTYNLQVKDLHTMKIPIISNFVFDYDETLNGLRNLYYYDLKNNSVGTTINNSGIGYNFLGNKLLYNLYVDFGGNLNNIDDINKQFNKILNTN